jgi:hypothetical protein
MCLAATRHHADAIDGRKGAAANLSLNSTVGIHRLHARHHRLERGAALGALEVGVEQPVEGGLHVRRAEGLAVVPLHVLSQVKRIRSAVGGNGPALGEIADDLARLVRVVLQQPAVDAGGRLLDDQRRLRVHVQTPGIAVVEPGQDAAGAGLLLGARRTGREPDGGQQRGGQGREAGESREAHRHR